MTALAEALFQQLQRGEEQVRVLESVVAETIFVLTSRNLYNVARSEVRDRLAFALTLTGVEMENKARALQALELYAEQRRLSFVDALIAVAAMEERPSEVYSFDEGFDRIDGVTRVEPSLTT
jgi:predicted nucleic acid-binding protein